MPSIEFKCKIILYNRIQMIGSRYGSVLMGLTRKWDLPSKQRNPPNIYQVPSTLPYFRQYAVDMACLTPYSTDETRKHFKRRIYAVLLRMAEAALGPSEPRIVRKHPEKTWKHIWTNLHTTGLTDTLKSTWYIAIRGWIQNFPDWRCKNHKTYYKSYRPPSPSK